MSDPRAAGAPQPDPRQAAIDALCDLARADDQSYVVEIVDALLRRLRGAPAEEPPPGDPQMLLRAAQIIEQLADSISQSHMARKLEYRALAERLRASSSAAAAPPEPTEADVFHALTPQAKRRTSAENVADVLAALRAGRSRAAAGGPWTTADTEAALKVVANAIETTSHCPHWATEGDEESCDGLNGCDDCLREAAIAVLAALNRAGALRSASSSRAAAGGGEPTDEATVRADEVQRALDRMCSECRKGNPVDPVRGKHRIYHDVLGSEGQNTRAYWTVCGRDDWTGKYLEKRLAELRSAPSQRKEADR